ncbi:hypothetical protein C0J52_18009 [Blattella germanica]|nr:hypothetical protein C0J52_18009 [Blattella germanica]
MVVERFNRYFNMLMMSLFCEKFPDACLEEKKNKLGILAVQEMGWKGEGIMRSGDFTVFYKGGQRYLFGTGFIVNNIWKNAI